MGHTTNLSILNDQRREFLWVLNFVEYIMPCPICRAHYRSWRNVHPLDRLPLSPNFQAAVRQWLNELHQNINTLMKKPTEFPPTSIPLQPILTTFLEIVRPAVQLRLIDQNAYHRFKTHYELFLRFCR